jgi:hypothetical protein
LNKGLTCATFNWYGKMDVSIDLLIKDVIGPVTKGNVLSDQFLISSLLSLKTIFIPFCQLFAPDMGVKQPF